MIYKLHDQHGQTHVGYFAVDAARKLRIIKREQYNSRALAMGRIERRCQFTATAAQRYVVRFVVDADQGQIESYATEGDARDAMLASMAPAVAGMGMTRAIEVHLYTQDVQRVRRVTAVMIDDAARAAHAYPWPWRK